MAGRAFKKAMKKIIRFFSLLLGLAIIFFEGWLAKRKQ